MAYDEELADRCREALQDENGITEKAMFGGLAFLKDRHLAVAASGQGGLLVRVDPSETHRLVDDVHVHRMVMRGRAMDGWLRVDPPGIAADAALSAWVRRALAFVATLPPK